MNFHPTTAPRIREISSTCAVEHRATLHYSDSRSPAGNGIALAVVKGVEEVRGDDTSIR